MTFELKKGGLTATAQTRGGELVSLRSGDGREYIWESRPLCSTIFPKSPKTAITVHSQN